MGRVRKVEGDEAEDSSGTVTIMSAVTAKIATIFHPLDGRLPHLFGRFRALVTSPLARIPTADHDALSIPRVRPAFLFNRRNAVLRCIALSQTLANEPHAGNRSRPLSGTFTGRFTDTGRMFFREISEVRAPSPNLKVQTCILRDVTHVLPETLSRSLTSLPPLFL